MSEDRDNRTSVDKALALLSAFGDEASTGIGVSELARRTNLSKSTAFRLLGMLERNRAVERAGSNYRLGPMMHELASPIVLPEVEEIRDCLTPFLAHLYERTRQTVHLAVLQGVDVVYLNKLHGLHQVSSPSRIGGRVPAYCTAVGKVLLAHSPSQAEEVLASELAPWTPHTITDPAVLRRQLDRIRQDHVAFDRDEITVGLNCVAGVVLSTTASPVAALSVSGPTGKFDPRTQAPAVRQVCSDAGRAFAAWRRAHRRHVAG